MIGDASVAEFVAESMRRSFRVLTETGSRLGVLNSHREKIFAEAEPF